MPRFARIVMNNTAYHIVCRSSQRQEVFHSDRDYEKMASLLWKYKNKFNTKIYAYCFMPNHIHLLLDPADNKKLCKLMHGLCLSYAMYFNIKYKKCGHLWQNRYKSFLVQKDQYLINVVSYIEYNPVKANMCARAEEYPWSSYLARVSGKNDKLFDEYRMDSRGQV